MALDNVLRKSIRDDPVRFTQVTGAYYFELIKDPGDRILQVEHYYIAGQ